MAKVDNRKREYAFIVYPESAPENWIEILDNLHIPSLISPLHDLDLVGDGSGDLKKAHYHVILFFSGKKSAEQVIDILKPLDIKYVEPINDKKGAIQYLWHKNNPEKAQYDYIDVVPLNGADYTRYTVNDDDDLLGEILDIIEDNSFTNIRALVLYIRYEKPHLLPTVVKNTYFFTNYIKHLV